MRKVKNLARRVLGLKNLTDFYSQGGEDAVASNTFQSLIPVKNGFFLDVGAYHPYHHSNTYLLYKAGWRGINIDPRESVKRLFDAARPRDINIQVGIAAEDGVREFYELKEGLSSMSSFSYSNIEKLGLTKSIRRVIELPVLRLSSLLRQYPELTKLDYLNIDAEGLETEILSGLPDGDLRPTVISIEQNGPITLEQVLNSETCQYLKSLRYVPYAKNILLKDVSTVFYASEDFTGNV
ncbi:MAG: FkbM family methyltransferase [Pyrinomonadaceae bacterium]